MSAEFKRRFEKLTGDDPFPWQCELFARFVSGKVPSSCNLPTGLGKTRVIVIWLLALASGARLPRRLVYVVNRRTVVDQTTNEVEMLRKSLPKLEGLPEEFRKLALSTLRGQFADNREWSADPSRPAVICGTVDIIGSRLLFSGYGVGFKSKPLHAGFLGQDVLLVHDEAHLEPAFQELLIAIEAEQVRCKELGKFRVMELSATPRKGASDSANEKPFGLTKEDHKNTVIKKRIRATKMLRLHAINDAKKLADQVVELALRYKDSQRSILVFLRTVEDVEKVAARLTKEKQQVETLTGTLRGWERDDLTKRPVFLRFLPPSNRPADPVLADGTVYLVCTSAGEVGVNISADHLVCDLSTFDSMAQRFGRVNRFGNCDDTEIHVVHLSDYGQGGLEERLQRTLELLKQLNGDGSPQALSDLCLDDRVAAFAPPPEILPTSDILFDAWSLTTIRGKLPGRPPVEPYLHGISEWQPPETLVAWREEVDVIIGDLLERYRPEDLLEDYALKPHELLRDRSDRVFKHLEAIASRHPGKPVWLISDQGQVEFHTIAELANKNQKERIYYRTILLPLSAGGLEGGRLNGGSEAWVKDVTDEWYEGSEKPVQRRVRLWKDSPELAEKPRGMRIVRPPIVIQRINEDGETENRYWYWFTRPRSADDDLSKTATQPVRLADHVQDVVCNTTRIARALDLPSELQRALTLAAKCHDLGKQRETWQRSIGNPNPYDWHAKSGWDATTKTRWRPRDLCRDYRHEFGSILDVLHPIPNEAPDFLSEVDELERESAGMKDLVIHLIAAHHGRARPHFPGDEAEASGLDRDSQFALALAGQTPRRFARLQRRYGRWGLAYLESILRAADWAASTNPVSCTTVGEAES